TQNDPVAQDEKYICVFQMAGDGEGIAWKVLDVESHYPKELGGSLELSNDTFFSLKIKNTTSRNSGIYKCTLWEQSGERNLSGTVTLKVTGCPGIEDEKFKKYKSELFMLTCLGIFYLLLIFFTCTCLRKESMSPNYQKNRPDMKHMLTLINVHEMRTFQDLNSDSACKNELTSRSVQVDVDSTMGSSVNMTLGGWLGACLESETGETGGPERTRSNGMGAGISVKLAALTVPFRTGEGFEPAPVLTAEQLIIHRNGNRFRPTSPTRDQHWVGSSSLAR
ncbi:PREDICTED: CD83 antigen, partial [Phaethon lepturus]|uniref:CD83 antigen n=1 Tax=Phaethon lepturus TaxID=97097 RepID=UPI0005304FE8